MKAVLRGKFRSLSAYIKKVEKAHASDLTAHLKALEPKETDSLRRSRRQEIIKLMAEINKIETKQYKASMKQRAVSLRKLTRWTNLYPN